jgi:hypothetical protein
MYSRTEMLAALGSIGGEAGVAAVVEAVAEVVLVEPTAGAVLESIAGVVIESIARVVLASMAGAFDVAGSAGDMAFDVAGV